MAHLEILEEIECLRHANISVALEDHHGKGLSWLHVTNNELGDNVKTNSVRLLYQFMKLTIV
jgi:hypothetical protein